MIKRLLLNVTIGFISLVITALFIEGALRVVGFKPPDLVTLDKYKDMNKLYLKNSEARWMGNLGREIEFDNIVRTNSLGFHDKDYAVVKDKDVFRILCLGDSYVEAMQVPLEKTFHKLLEERLNSKGKSNAWPKRIEVMAMGGSGNGSLRELITFKNKGLQFSPDLVIVFLTAQNDFKDDWHYYRIVTGTDQYQHVNLKPPDEVYKKLKRYRRLRFFKNSLLNQWIAFKIIEIADKKHVKENNTKAWKERLGIYALPNSPMFEEGKEKWEEAFKILATNYINIYQIAKKNGAEMFVVFNDRRPSFEPHAYKYLYKLMPEIKENINFDYPVLKLKRVLEQYQIPSMDLNPVFIEAFEKTGITGHFKKDGHWTQIGHERVANQLETYLTPYIARRLAL